MDIRTKTRRRWTKTQVIDLRFAPFEEEDRTERNIIDDIINHILRVAKSEMRNQKVLEPDFYFNFDNSESLIGIDVSSIEDDYRSYLDQLFLLTRIYPYVLINCGISARNLYTLPLHRQLHRKRFILPVFRRIPPCDFQVEKERFGEIIYDLVSGKTSTINKNKLRGLNESFMIEDLHSRFPGIILKDENTIKHKPIITWLGVEDDSIKMTLTHLFNENIEQFDFDFICNKFQLDKVLFQQYVEESYLFGAGEDGKIIFRMLKKDIYIGLMFSLLNQFEQEMVDRRVIDTTHTDYPRFTGEFVEYHTVGRLFDAKDTFSFKLLNYVKQCFHEIGLDRIIILENGHEQKLYQLCKEIVFAEVGVSRVTNYYGNPLLYPFDVIKENENVAIIADVINTGNFLVKTVQFLENNFDCKVVSVFSFILGSNTTEQNWEILRNREEYQGIHYYIEKKLQDVSAIRQASQHARFLGNQYEGFLTFWQTVARHGSIERNLFKNSNRIMKINDEKINMTDFIFHRLELDINSLLSNARQEHLFVYLERILCEHSFDIALCDSESSQAILSAIVMKCNLDCTVKVISKTKRKTLARHLSSSENILIFSFAINVGSNLLSSYNKIKSLCNPNVYIHCLSLFKRINLESSSSEASDNFWFSIVDTISNWDVYYYSGLPYYLFPDGSGKIHMLETIGFRR